MAEHLAQDTIVSEQAIFDAEALARAAGLPQVDFQGVRCVLWDPAVRTTLSLPAPGSWGGHDQLVFRVGLPAGFGCEMSVRVDLAGRTEGLPQADHLSTIQPLGAGCRTAWDGWGEVVYPIENFSVVGRSAGWAAARGMVLGLHYGDPSISRPSCSRAGGGRRGRA